MGAGPAACFSLSKLLCLQVYRGVLFGSLPVAVKVLHSWGSTGMPRQLPFAPPPIPASPDSPGSRLSGSSTASTVQRQQLQDLRQQLAGQDAEAQQRWFWREAEILRQCAHPSLVQLLGVYSGLPPQQQQTSPQQMAQQQRRRQQQPHEAQRRQLMIITELLEGGSLQDRLGDPELSWRRL